jgi:hypothetical protein
MRAPEPAATRLRNQLDALIVNSPYTLHERGEATVLSVAGSPIMTMFEPVDDAHFAAYFYCRTTSWDWIGERTDLHDVGSVVFAAALRASVGTSTRLRDSYNPATSLAGELYGRYILPEQPLKSSLLLEHTAEQAEPLLTGAELGHSLLHRLGLFSHGTSSQRFSRDTPELRSWTDVVRAALLEDDDEPLREDALAYQRGEPSWLYYRSEGLGLSVVQSRPLASTVRFLARAGEDLAVKLPSVNGELQMLDGVGNFISSASASGCLSILNEIEQSGARPALMPATFAFLLPLEDTLVASAGDHVLIMEDETSRHFFERERAELRRRHEREARLLYPSTVFRWTDPPDPARFEEMIRELLEREEGVLFVRKAGPTYDRDAGRDLIVDRILPRAPEEQLQEGASPFRHARIVGQCKVASNGRSVGSHRVLDVLDTIVRHSADGYLLAVSTELSSSVVDKLDRYRREGRGYIEWWTRLEIEQRLRQHRDIADRYHDLVGSALPASTPAAP